MRFNSSGGELALHELPVFGKLVAAMGEEETVCFDAYIPGNRPLPVVFDFPDWLCLSKYDLMVSNTASVLPHRDDMIHGAEYGVEADNFPSEEVFPLGRWETEGRLSRREDPLLDLGDVFAIDSQEVRIFGEVPSLAPILFFFCVPRHV